MVYQHLTSTKKKPKKKKNNFPRALSAVRVSLATLPPKASHCHNVLREKRGTGFFGLGLLQRLLLPHLSSYCVRVVDHHHHHHHHHDRSTAAAATILNNTPLHLPTMSCRVFLVGVRISARQDERTLRGFLGRVGQGRAGQGRVG